MIEKIEKITETMTNVFLTVTMITLTLFAIFAIFVIGFMAYGLTHQEFDYSCAYCHGTITEDADYVCMTDGHRMHAECYLRHIEEGDNGKANSETP